jgi:hypothetical protein
MPNTPPAPQPPPFSAHLSSASGTWTGEHSTGLGWLPSEGRGRRTTCSRLCARTQSPRFELISISTITLDGVQLGPPCLSWAASGESQSSIRPLPPQPGSYSIGGSRLFHKPGSIQPSSSGSNPWPTWVQPCPPNGSATSLLHASSPHQLGLPDRPLLIALVNFVFLLASCGQA